MSQQTLFQADRRCPQCNKVKPLAAFPGWRQGRTGQYCYCAECRTKYMRTYFASYEPTDEQRQRTAMRNARTLLNNIPPSVNLHTVGRYRTALRSDPCAYCGDVPLQNKWTGRTLGEIDHIEPTSGNGERDWTNETGACRSCNQFKRATPLLHFLLDVQGMRSFRAEAPRSPASRRRAQGALARDTS